MLTYDADKQVYFTACKDFAVQIKQQIIKIILCISELPSTDGIAVASTALAMRAMRAL